MSYPFSVTDQAFDLAARTLIYKVRNHLEVDILIDNYNIKMHHIMNLIRYSYKNTTIIFS